MTNLPKNVTKMEEIYSKYEELYSLVQEEKFDVEKALKLTKLLRLKMLNIPFLVPGNTTVPNEAKVMLRSVLELSAKVTVMSGDVDQFFRIVEELKISYFQQKELERSSEMEIIFSLYLVALIAQNRLIEFNIEYEQFLTLTSHDSELLGYARALADAVTDNSFSRIVQLKDEAPSVLFNKITKSILDGARESHANCIEAAYTDLTTMELAQILHFRTVEKAVAFAEKRGWQMNEEKTAIFFAKDETRKVLDNKSFERSIGLCVTVSSLA